MRRTLNSGIVCRNGSGRRHHGGRCGIGGVGRAPPARKPDRRVGQQAHHQGRRRRASPRPRCRHSRATEVESDDLHDHPVWKGHAHYPSRPRCGRRR